MRENGLIIPPPPKSEDDQKLLGEVKKIKDQNPDFGVLKVLAELKKDSEWENLLEGKLKKLMKQNGLTTPNLDSKIDNNHQNGSNTQPKTINPKIQGRNPHPKDRLRPSNKYNLQSRSEPSVEFKGFQNTSNHSNHSKDSHKIYEQPSNLPPAMRPYFVPAKDSSPLQQPQPQPQQLKSQSQPQLSNPQPQNHSQNQAQKHSQNHSQPQLSKPQTQRQSQKQPQSQPLPSRDNSPAPLKNRVIISSFTLGSTSKFSLFFFLYSYILLFFFKFKFFSDLNFFFFFFLSKRCIRNLKCEHIQKSQRKW